jgi:hypothetical protein
LTYVVSVLLIPDLGGDPHAVVEALDVITCGTLAGAIIPELVKVSPPPSRATSRSRHVVAGRRARR